MTASLRTVDVTGVAVAGPPIPELISSTLWVEVRPDLRRIHVLAGDILAALGKRRDVAGKGRNEHEDVAHAIAWLRAYDITQLVVTEAQRLHPLILTGLTKLAAEAGASLWLLHRPPRGDAFMRALGRKRAVAATLADVPMPVDAATPRDAMPAALPAVPADEFVTFRTACTAALPAVDAAAVEAYFTGVARRCSDAFAQHGATRDTVADELYRILNAAPADAELTVAIRALQVAAWHSDLYVKIDMPRLLHSEERPRISYDDADAALVAYRQPHRALTVALTRAGHGVADIAAVQVSAVAPDGANVSVAGTDVALGPHSTRAARAQVHLREIAGAQPTEALIPHSPKALAKVLTEAATDLGLHVFGRRAERTRNHTDGALRALGITVTSLP